MTRIVRVAVVEDHPVFREGLTSIINAADDLELALASQSLADFDDWITRSASHPDVVLLDLNLPGIQGAEAVQYMRRLGLLVLVISASIDETTVVEAICVGAAGYLSKEAEPEEVVRATRMVADGHQYVSPTLAGYLLRKQVKFTKREEEVLRLLASGETDRDIAEQLFISVHTVHSHLDRIASKTGSRHRVDLTRLAIRRGLLSRHQEKR